MKAAVCFNDLPQHPPVGEWHALDAHLVVQHGGEGIIVGVWTGDYAEHATFSLSLDDARALRDELRDAVDYAEIAEIEARTIAAE